jgi:phage tail P2-like protein
MSEVVSLLPINATPQERALSAAGARAAMLPVPVRDMWSPDTCPVAHLPWLAWAMSVDEWDSAWSEVQKREAIKASFFVHQRKGTVGAVRAALEALGYGARVLEWFQETPKAAPYTFAVDVELGDRGITEAVYDEAERIALATKNARSHLSRVRAIGRTRAALHVGAAAVGGELGQVLPYLLTRLTASVRRCLGARVTSFESARLLPDPEVHIRPLFADGEAGAWYDFGDLSTMFQDVAGSIPAALEQPVALVRDKSGRGNHLVQATVAARPVLSARVNMLTRSQDFVGGWTKGGTAQVAANVARAPDGTITASRLSIDGATSLKHFLGQSVAIAAGGTYTASIYVKQDGFAFADVVFGKSGSPWNRAACRVNLLTGAFHVRDVGAATLFKVAAVEPAPDGWWRVIVTAQADSASVDGYVEIYPTPDFGVATNVSGTGGILVWGAQLAAGLAPLRYQLVGAGGADYDARGFARYLQFDGADDFMSSATGGGMTAQEAIAAVMPTGGSGTSRDWLNDGGGVSYRWGASTGGQYFTLQSNQGPTAVAAATLGVPVVHGGRSGAALVTRVNGIDGPTLALNTMTAPSAGFTLGAFEGGAAGRWHGRLYALVWRAGNFTPTQRGQVERYLAAKNGATLA